MPISAELGEFHLADVQRARARRPACADQLGPHHHLRHARRPQPRAWRDVHARRLRGLGRLHLYRLVRRGRHRRLPVRHAGRRGDGTLDYPAVLFTPARGPDTRHLRPRHRLRRGGALHFRRPLQDGAAAARARWHHVDRLHAVSDLSPRAARHRRRRPDRALSRSLSHPHRHDRAGGHRGLGDGRCARHRRLQGLHARLRHWLDGGRLRRHRECAGGLDRAGRRRDRSWCRPSSSS